MNDDDDGEEMEDGEDNDLDNDGDDVSDDEELEEEVQATIITHPTQVQALKQVCILRRVHQGGLGSGHVHPKYSVIHTVYT